MNSQFVAPTAAKALERRRAFYQSIADKADRLKAAKMGIAVEKLGEPVDVEPALAPDERIEPLEFVELENLREQIAGVLKDLDAAISEVTQTAPRIVRIQRIVAAYFEITRIDLISDRRTRVLVRPRQIAQYLAKELTPLSYPAIGRKFGGKDHTTVLHGVRRTKELMREDPAFCQDVANLFFLITGQHQ